jgi:hypothetical protein
MAIGGLPVPDATNGMRVDRSCGRAPLLRGRGLASRTGSLEVVIAYDDDLSVAELGDVGRYPSSSVHRRERVRVLAVEDQVPVWLVDEAASIRSATSLARKGDARSSAGPRARAAGKRAVDRRAVGRYASVRPEMIVPMRGDEELDRRAADLAGRLPVQLASLARIAYDYRWCWYPGGDDVFRSIDEGRWELCGQNPVRLLQEVSGATLARAAGDPVLLARVASLEDAFGEGVTGRSVGPVVSERPVAFFCAEFGVHQSLPVYSGGVGGLAGDLLKEASDRALVCV